MNVTVPPHNNHKMLWDSKRSVCIKTPRKPWLSNWSIVDFRPISTCAIFSKNPGTPITYNINRSLRHATSHQIALSLKRRSYKWFKVKKTWLVICFLFPLIWPFFFAFSQISRISPPSGIWADCRTSWTPLTPWHRRSRRPRSPLRSPMPSPLPESFCVPPQSSPWSPDPIFRKKKRGVEIMFSAGQDFD